ncbi:cytochrome P450 [Amanita rubescens]|nr:cytochrome P450 [Amanita rubescens]
MNSNVVTALVTLTVVYFASSIWKTVVNYRKLSAIPTAGGSGLFRSYVNALKFVKHGREIVQEGYDKYRGSLFKVSMPTQWMIVGASPQLIDDIRRAPEDQLSLKDATAEMFHTDILLGHELHEDDFHVEVIRTYFTKNLAAQFNEVVDEMKVSFEEFVPTKGEEWTTLIAYKANLSIVCRVLNRFLIGMPLCRDPDYRTLNEQFAVDALMAGNILNLFPIFLRSIVVYFLRKVPRGIQRGIKHLEPLIKERLEKEAQYGENWPGKPNDAISWLLEVGKKPHQRTIKGLTIRILLMNFAGIHTTTMQFTHALYHLAAHPEYVQPMREEVEAAIREDGWTKAAIDKLRKVDSFLRESQRMHGSGLFSMHRKVMKKFTFSNGVTIPTGYLVSAPQTSVHYDPDNYPDPDVFDGFRHARMREKEGEGAKHVMMTPTLNYLPFGHGRSACPGRFFAASEIKLLLAHVLLNYDMKLAGCRGQPADWWFGFHSMPDPTVEVMFRKRT